MQYLSSNTTHQLVADHRAALDATARRGRLRRMLTRTAEVDLVALERREVVTPAVILPAPATAATTAATRVDKVA